MRSKPASIASTAGFVIFTVAIFLSSALAATHEKLLHRFLPHGADGAFPEAPLVADSAGNYYGTANIGGSYNAGTVFELSPRAGGGWTEKVLHNFRASGGDGNFPFGNLIFDSHGNLYGTTWQGGAAGAGIVYVLEPQSNGMWKESVLYNFCAQASCADGSSPIAGLIFDDHGNLYGTTEAGGANSGGTVFELSLNHGGGWTESVLYSFNPNNGVDAGYPEAGLTFDSLGNLYGVANGGGAQFEGAVFQLSPAQGGGWNEQVLYSFCSQNGCADGANPFYAGVILDSAGNVYGTTQSGGVYNGGVVFELSPGQNGWTETVLHNFGHGTDGRNPGYSALLMDRGHNLFGTTSWGGKHSRGTVYELSPKGSSWTSKTLHNFELKGSDGWYPFAGLILDHGKLVGTTAGGGDGSQGTVFQLTPGKSGWTEGRLYSFNFNGADGADPEFANLVFDKAGNLYGTTYPGGIYDSGAAFELKPNGKGQWTEQILYSFGGGTNAGDSATGMIFDSHGNLYGASSTGGIFGDWGTVFELSPRQGGEWTQKVLYSFNFNGTDGYYPFGSPVFDASGNLYGTTSVGGQENLGIVYQLKPNGSGGWTETILHSFVENGTDGFEPYSGLTIDSAGNLYGTTAAGGSSGVGTIFELSPDGQGGWTEQVLYAFNPQNSDGYIPFGGNLIFDAAHNLYGTTQYGGVNGGGTVFQLTPHKNESWTERVLYSFCAQTNCADGIYPRGTLVFNAQGDLYGTTISGGAYQSESGTSSGTLFKLTPTHGGNWTETVLHSFNSNSGDGSYPEGGLIFDASGTNLFGTTYYGGSTYNAGTVFEITP
jgi:uncharacterized repeat protein (TIGR03803 family)